MSLKASVPWSWVILVGSRGTVGLGRAGVEVMEAAEES
jgi:hypothetical protein